MECFPLKSDKLANFALKSQPQDCEKMWNAWNILGMEGEEEKRECRKPHKTCNPERNLIWG